MPDSILNIPHNQPEPALLTSLGVVSPLEKQKTLISKRFNSIKKIIFSQRPLLEKIYREKGNLSLFEIAYLNHQNKQSKINKSRQREFINTFKQEVGKLLGSDVATSVATQLTANYYVSTTEHHGPITHSGKLNSAFLTSLLYSYLNETSLKNVIVLACANISFDNYTFPRGIEFNSYKNNEINLQNLVFYPRAVRPRPVVYYPSYKIDTIINMKSKLAEMVVKKEITKEVALQIQQILDEIYADPKVLSSKLFSDQVSITNFHLWKKIQQIQQTPTNLIYLEQEKIVNQLILKYHLTKDTLINKILFNSKYQKLILKHFDNIMGAFNLETKSGTYLFWGLPKGSKYRVQLWKKGNKLVTQNGSYSLNLDPTSISRTIKNREIYPSTLLSFLILSFYYGVKLLGSFNQTSYLTQMKYSFINFLKETRNEAEIEYVEAIPTTDLVYPRPILAFLENSVPKTPRIEATGLDLILYKNAQTFTSLFKNASSIKLKEALDRVMPDLYISYVPEQNHLQKYLEITSETIERMSGLDIKINSCVKIAANVSA